MSLILRNSIFSTWSLDMIWTVLLTHPQIFQTLLITALYISFEYIKDLESNNQLNNPPKDDHHKDNQIELLQSTDMVKVNHTATTDLNKPYSIVIGSQFKNQVIEDETCQIRILDLQKETKEKVDYLKSKINQMQLKLNTKENEIKEFKKSIHHLKKSNQTIQTQYQLLLEETKVMVIEHKLQVNNSSVGHDTTVLKRDGIPQHLNWMIKKIESLQTQLLESQNSSESLLKIKRSQDKCIEGLKNTSLHQTRQIYLLWKILDSHHIKVEGNAFAFMNQSTIGFGHSVDTLIEQDISSEVLETYPSKDLLPLDLDLEDWVDCHVDVDLQV
ncbi:hypothetical protein HDV02_006066 [Globomyces sp. JEL0801]|nr:hypothetical protein HDV02_006066 [Globomyces sp. JEL0801]